MALESREIGQIAVTVRDVDAALIYYRDKLGLTFLFRPGRDLAFVAAGSATMPDHDLWIGFVRDPDGNPAGLMEEKRQEKRG